MSGRKSGRKRIYPYGATSIEHGGRMARIHNESGDVDDGVKLSEARDRRGGRGGQSQDESGHRPDHRNHREGHGEHEANGENGTNGENGGAIDVHNVEVNVSPLDVTRQTQATGDRVVEDVEDVQHMGNGEVGDFREDGEVRDDSLPSIILNNNSDGDGGELRENGDEFIDDGKINNLFKLYSFI